MLENIVPVEQARRSVNVNDILVTPIRVDGKKVGTHYDMTPDSNWKDINKFDKATQVKKTDGSSDALSDHLLNNVRTITELAYKNKYITEQDINRKDPLKDKDGNEIIGVERTPLSFLEIKNNKLIIPDDLTAQQTQELMFLIYGKVVNNVDRDPGSRKQPDVLIEDIQKAMSNFSEAGRVDKSAKLILDTQSPQTVLRALNIGLRKSVERTIKERTYSTTKDLERKGESATKRLLQRLEVGAHVKDEVDGPTINKIVEGKMGVFTDKKGESVDNADDWGKPAGRELEQTVQYDLLMAQAFDVLVPPEARLEMEQAEIAISKERNYMEKAKKMADLTKTRQVWRIAMLDYFNASKLIPGTEFSQYANDLNNNKIFSPEEQDLVHKYSKEIGQRKASLDRKFKNGFNDLNIDSVNTLKAQELLLMLKPAGTVQIPDGLNNILSRAHEITEVVGDSPKEIKAKKDALIKSLIKESGILTGLQEEKRELAEKILRDVITTKNSIDKRLRGMPNSDVDVKYGALDFASSIDSGIKGIDLLYRRGLSQTIDEADRYYGHDIVRDANENTHLLRKLKKGEKRGKKNGFGEDLPPGGASSEGGSASMNQEHVESSVSAAPVVTEADKQYETFNSLSAKDKIAVVYLKEMFVGEIPQDIEVSANWREALKEGMNRDINEIVADLKKSGIITTENGTLKINGKTLNEIIIPEDYPGKTVNEPGKEVEGGLKPEDISNDTEVQKRFLFYKRRSTALKGLKGGENKDSEFTYQGNALRALEEEYGLDTVFDLANVLGLGEDIWSAKQLAAASQGNQNFEIKRENGQTTFNVFRLSLNSVDDLETLSSMSEVFKGAKIQIESLNVVITEDGPINVETVIKGFKIGRLDLDATSIDQKINIKTEGTEITNLHIFKGDYEIEMDQLPLTVFIAETGSNLNLDIKDKDSLEKAVSPSSKEASKYFAVPIVNQSSIGVRVRGEPDSLMTFENTTGDTKLVGLVRGEEDKLSLAVLDIDELPKAELEEKDGPLTWADSNDQDAPVADNPQTTVPPATPAVSQSSISTDDLDVPTFLTDEAKKKRKTEILDRLPKRSTAAMQSATETPAATQPIETVSADLSMPAEAESDELKNQTAETPSWLKSLAAEKLTDSREAAVSAPQAESTSAPQTELENARLELSALNEENGNAPRYTWRSGRARRIARELENKIKDLEAAQSDPEQVAPNITPSIPPAQPQATPQPEPPAESAEHGTSFEEVPPKNETPVKESLGAKLLKKLKSLGQVDTSAPVVNANLDNPPERPTRKRKGAI